MSCLLYLDKDYNPIQPRLLEIFQQNSQKPSYFLLPNLNLIKQATEQVVFHDEAILFESQFATFDKFALTVLSKSNEQFQIINTAASTVITVKAMQQLLAENKFSWFNHFDRVADLAPLLVSLFGELKRNGFRVDNITGSPNSKEKDILTLFSAYQEKLVMDRLLDNEEVIRKAVELINKGISFDGNSLIISGFSLNILQITLIQALRYQFANIIVYMQYDATRSEVFIDESKAIKQLQKIGFSVIDITEKETSLTVDRLIFQAGNDRKSLKPAIALRGFQSQRHEVREIIRVIKSLIIRDQLQPNEIAIVTRQLTDYAELLAYFSKQAGVPIQLKPYKRLANTLPVQKMLLLLKVAACRWSADVFLEFLTADFLWPDEVNAPLMADFVRMTPINGPLSEWLAACNKQLAYAQFIEQERDYEQEHHSSFSTTDLKSIEVGLIYLADLWQRLIPTSADYPTWQSCLLKLMSTFGFEDSIYKQIEIADWDVAYNLHQVWEQTIQSINEQHTIGHLWPTDMDLATFYYLIKDVLSVKLVPVEPLDIEGVHVFSPVEFSGQSYKQVFILGANEGVWPSGRYGSWLSSKEDEQESLLLLNTAAEHLGREKLYLLRTISGSTESICISYILKDNAGAELTPFSFLYDLKSTADIQTNNKTPLWPTTISDAVSPAEALELFVLSNEKQYWPLSLLNRINAEKMRWTNTASIYNGGLQNKAIKDQLHSSYGINKVFSTTMLEQYAKCPWAYYIQRVLHIKPVEPLPFGVTALSRGNILHHVLARFLQNYRLQTLELEQRELYETQLQQLLQDEIKRIQAIVTREGALWVEVESERVLYLLKLWLDNEIALQSKIKLRPVELEVAFKYQIKTSEQPFFIEGFIDRIDVDEDSLAIYDYKSGLTPRLTDIKDGVALQIPCYLLAAAELYPDKQILGGGYYKLCDNFNHNSGMWREETLEAIDLTRRIGDKVADNQWDELLKHVIDQAITYRQLIQNGEFNLQPRRPCPNFCAYRDICRMNALLFARIQQEEETNNEIY